MEMRSVTSKDRDDEGDTVDLVPPSSQSSTRTTNTDWRIVFSQVRLLCWKRYLEMTRNPTELGKLVGIPCLFFLLVILLYANMSSLFKYGLIPYGFFEVFLIPPAFWIVIQRCCVYVMHEKIHKLKESMQMMGLYETSYYISLFITEALMSGFVLSLVTSLFTLYPHFFNNAPYGDIFAVFFVNCLAAIPFALFLCYFMTDMRMASIGSFLVIILFYAIFIAVMYSAEKDTNNFLGACLIPPLALQVASFSLSFGTQGELADVNNNDDWGDYYRKKAYLPSIPDICGVMFASAIIYTVLLLALHFSEAYWNDIYNLLTGTKTVAPSVIQNPLNDMEESKGLVEAVDERFLGKPTVELKNLTKTFGDQVAVKGLSFKMYENQIFALLGHNGAGKTTTINMLTGALAPDTCTQGTGASIYGHSIHDSMDKVHKLLGVCPQHDVLFENLTVLDHIIFFSMLKGSTYEAAAAEATEYATTFHFEKRLRHTGSELSGGQKRKLSVAIAICGGSKFVVLDEPTAGMDPLARRELWDLLSNLRKGRTILLTTHYMDETNVLGDRTAIINLGGLACLGSNQYLKQNLGAGYRLVFDISKDQTPDQARGLQRLMQTTIPTATLKETDKNAGFRENDLQLTTGESRDSEGQVVYTLPFDTVNAFGSLFKSIGGKEEMKATYGVADVGINIADLEEVFLKVGGDESVKPKMDTASMGIGMSTHFEPTFARQCFAIAFRRLNYAFNDVMIIPTLLFPVAAVIAAAVVYSQNPTIIKGSPEGNAIFLSFLVGCMYFVGFMMVPGFIADFLVNERVTRLRNVLTVMGCDFRAFWVGNFVADYLLLSIPMIIMWISWGAADMHQFYRGVDGAEGASFFIIILFVADVIAFGYIFSWLFNVPQLAGAFMPFIVLGLLVLPMILIFIGLIINEQLLGHHSADSSVVIGSLLWGICLFSPHGGVLVALLDTTADFSGLIKEFPPYSAVMAIMAVETAVFLLASYTLDSMSVIPLEPKQDPKYTNAAEKLAELHQDVRDERENTFDPSKEMQSLCVKGLRKVFPSKLGKFGRDIVATEDVAFSVREGECFGLLGANGAGKSTTIAMVTRHLEPSQGDAYVHKTSVLSDFTGAAQNLGVVTQNNSLWDLMSVQDHLFLFARLRGIPEANVQDLVTSTIDQMELTPHKHKLSCRLSGGMKRKLCVAISLIGDPGVVLLDEPSAGLDPKSRRNLWDVILQTMKHRSVVLTTHSLEEAEALCDRIGIMVKGQLRVLGTKQHLKSLFGSGFELAVKLKMNYTSAEGLEKMVNAVQNFIIQVFPTASLISNNGGIMLLFRIPKDAMDLGLAFTSFEARKEDLNIEEYSISQPTLEQVFIRTVNEYTPGIKKHIRSSMSSDTAGGSARMSVTGALEMMESEEEEDKANAVEADKNACGCPSATLNYGTAITTVFIIFWAFMWISSSIGGHRELSFASFSITIVSVISCCVFCCCSVCPCCKKGGLDEQ